MANCIEDRYDWKRWVGLMVQQGSLIEAHSHYLDMVYFINQQRMGYASVPGDDLKQYAKQLLQVPEHFRATFEPNPAVASLGYERVLTLRTLEKCEKMLSE